MTYGRSTLATSLAALLALFAALPSQAQTHVVTRNEMREQLRAASAERQANLSRIDRALSTDAAAQALAAARVDPAQVRHAVSTLSDEELARLAARIDPANFTGSGINLSNQQVTIIIVGIILIVLVAVLVSR